MDLREVTDKQKSQYNKLVTHVIQSWEWGEARLSMGLPVLRFGIYNGKKLKTAFQLTLHKIPFTKKYVGYLPKGPVLDKELAKALAKIAKEQNCVFIKLEPDIKISNFNPAKAGGELFQISNSFHSSPKPLFTKYNFILDLTKSEDELLKAMHPKTRYNIRVAEKHGVRIEKRIDDEAFKIYLRLYFETTKRQGYHGHNESYHKKVWETLRAANMARLLIGYYQKKPLVAWMLLNFRENLYYPYGGSSKVHPEVMANNLVAWEAIKLGKKLGLKKFDMWGALGPKADSNDPWYGFHRFKQGYGGELVEYIGTFDFVLNWPLYFGFTFIDKLLPVKIFLLKLLRK